MNGQYKGNTILYVLLHESWDTLKQPRPGREESSMAATGYPVIDPTIKHVGVSKLRELNVAKLRETDDTFVIQDNNTPLAVLLSYEKFITMQQQLIAATNTLELLSDSHELTGVLAGIADMKAGRVQSLAQLEGQLQKKR